MRKKPTARLEYYRDKAGLLRWRLWAPNKRIIADSGQGYKSLLGAQRGWASVAAAGASRTLDVVRPERKVRAPATTAKKAKKATAKKATAKKAKKPSKKVLKTRRLIAARLAASRPNTTSRLAAVARRGRLAS